MRRTLSHIERITGYPNPFETWTLFACAIQGALVISGAAQSPTIDSTLAGRPGIRLVWALLLLLGGPVALTGLYWRGDPFTAVEIKRVGLVACGFGILIFGSALVLSGRAALVAGTFDTALAAGAFVRVWQVSRLLAIARARLSEVRETSDG